MIKKINKHFGWKPQLKKLMEECYEFCEAVQDYENKEGNKEHIEEEFADVLVVLYGYISRYNLDKKSIKEIMNFKCVRTIERINSGYYDKK